MCYAANDYLGYVLLEPAVRQEIRRVLWVVRWIFCTFKVTIHLCCSSLSEGKRSERDLTKFRLSLPQAPRLLPFVFRASSPTRSNRTPVKNKGTVTAGATTFTGACFPR